MLIKYMDELAQSGRFDLNPDGDVDVYLAELNGFTEDKGLAEWKIVGEESVPRCQLHYDDAADGSIKFVGSWQKFYAASCCFGDKPLFSGSEYFFKNNMPSFGGVAKAVIYLRYSFGFLNWLEKFEHSTANKIRNEIPAFDNLFEDKKSKRLPTNWISFKAPKEKWALPVVCSLANGSKIVWGLSGSADDDWGDLEELGVNIKLSLDLMSFFEAPKTAQKAVVSGVLQMGAGLGRNAFGKEYKLDKISDSEYTRLMGTVIQSSRKELVNIWACAEKLKYKIKVAPNPENSGLIFMPEGDLKYSLLKRFVDSENDKKQAYYNAKKEKNKSNEDSESLIAPRPAIIPVPANSQATLFLFNIEGAQKKKLIVQQIFPGVSLNYLSCINEEMLHSNIQKSVVDYMKSALTCQDGDTPSVYHYWTEIFTSALQMNYISANEIFNSFQRFCKAFRGDELVEKGRYSRASEYSKVIARLRRWQHLIHVARNTPEKLNTLEFQTELKAVEQYQLTEKGVFSMRKECPQTAELVGPVYGSLWDKQKEKLDAFVRQAWQGAPDDDFNLFVRGALTGMLLNELTYTVTKAGRSFSVTQGRHPSTLRGEQILSLVTKGIGLLINLNEQQRFNCNTLPFINSCLEDSRKDIFNSGLIMGLVFFHKSQEKEA